MANPVVVACTADTWVKVITGLTAATIRIMSDAPSKYLWTYIATTGAAPTNLSNAVPLNDGESLSFGASADVYVYARGKAGSVRIDT
ncbi:MAG: hypothetical protein JRJ62_00025 [Deltaproteobacteria bacterium]|nr:hypothetical protein [Deltaproteobacteria bacterium]